MEKAELYRPLPQPLPLVFVRGFRDIRPGLAPGGFAVRPQLRDCPGASAFLGESNLRRVFVLALVDGALVGKKGQQALLHGVAAVVACEYQLHMLSACFI